MIHLDNDGPEDVSACPITGKPERLCKGGRKRANAIAQKQLKAQQRAAEIARSQAKRERLKSQEELRRQTKALQAASKQNRGLISSLLEEPPETEVIEDDIDDDRASFGLSSTRRRKPFGFMNNFQGRQKLG